MMGLLVDSNVLLDVFEDDPVWAQWSEEMLEYYSTTHILCINPIIDAEVSVGFQRIEELEAAIENCGARMLQIPKEGLFLAQRCSSNTENERDSSCHLSRIFSLEPMRLLTSSHCSLVMYRGTNPAFPP